MSSHHHEHPYGKSENVLGFTEDSKVFVHDAPLKEMFLHPEVKHRKIVAFSIIGAYRKGKSFFLDYCLRYLYAHYPSIRFPNNPVSNPTGWLGDEDEPLAGFLWKSGTARVTTGIDLWNDVFLYTNESTGERIGIILIDTHGLFDNETSAIDNSRIFTLGTLVSSIQVLNLSGVIQDDQLQYIQFATECAKFTCAQKQEMSEKCFQNLVFLIRDWDNPDEYDYGIEGGRNYLEHFQKTMRTQKKDLQYICESIYSSFDSIECSLLPHPGKIVSRGKSGSKEYDGSWSDMDEEFKDELTKLIAHILSTDQIAIKKVNGTELTGEEYLKFIEIQLKTFQTDEALQAQTLYDSTIKTEMEKLLDTCVEHYKESGRKGQDTEDDLEVLHQKCKNDALMTYDNSKKLGGQEDFTKFRILLEKRIEKIYQEIKIQIENERKALEEARQKLRLEMEEKQKIEVERMERETKAAEERLENEKQKAKEKLELEQKIKDQEIAEIQRQAELERKAEEEQKKRERQKVDENIKKIEDAVEERRIELQELKKIEEEKERQRQHQEDLEKAASKAINTEHLKPKSPELQREFPAPDVRNIQEDSNSNIAADRSILKLRDSFTQTKTSLDNHTSDKFTNETKFDYIEPVRTSNIEKSSTSSSSHQLISSGSVPKLPTRNYPVQTQPTTSGYPGYPQQSYNNQESQRAITKFTNQSLDNTREFGEPKRVINLQRHSNPTFDNNELLKIFNHVDVRDRKVAVLAVSGNSKEERGIILDYCLKYLYAHYQSIKHNRITFKKGYSWSDPQNKFDSGFYAYNRRTQESAGVVIWNDVFLHAKDVAIIVMDVQGLFEHESWAEDNSKLFTLSSLISSMQVLNLSHYDPKKYLKELKYATSFSQFALHSMSGEPQRWFQNIVFLLRDLNYNVQYSSVDARNYFDSLFNVYTFGKKDLKSVHHLIQQSFQNYSAVLSPFFSQQPIQLVRLIENLLHPSNLITKTVHGEHVTALDYFEYLHSYFQSFKNYGFPSPQIIYQNIFGKQIVDKSYAYYIDYVLKNKDVIRDAKTLHTLSKDGTIIYFKSLCTKFRINPDYNPYTDMVIRKIDYIFGLYQSKAPENLQIIKRECQRVGNHATDAMSLLLLQPEPAYEVYEAAYGNRNDVGPSVEVTFAQSSSEMQVGCKIS